MESVEVGKKFEDVDTKKVAGLDNVENADAGKKFEYVDTEKVAGFDDVECVDAGNKVEHVYTSIKVACLDTRGRVECWTPETGWSASTPTEKIVMEVCNLGPMEAA